MNPFEQEVKISRPGTYKAFVEKSIIKLSVDESKMVEVKKEDRVKFRMCVNKISEQLEQKFSTLLDSDGNMWIKRTK